MTERERAYNAAIARETFLTMSYWRECLRAEGLSLISAYHVYKLRIMREYLQRLRREREHPPYVLEDLSKLRY